LTKPVFFLVPVPAMYVHLLDCRRFEAATTIGAWRLLPGIGLLERFSSENHRPSSSVK